MLKCLCCCSHCFGIPLQHSGSRQQGTGSSVRRSGQAGGTVVQGPGTAGGGLAGSGGCAEPAPALGWVGGATVPLLHPGFLFLPLQVTCGVTPNKSVHLRMSQFQLLSTVSCECLKIQTMGECPLFQAFHREETENRVCQGELLF